MLLPVLAASAYTLQAQVLDRELDGLLRWCLGVPALLHDGFVAPGHALAVVVGICRS